MVFNKKLSFEDIESKEIEKMENIEVRKQAKESAKEKVRLGLKYGELNFKSISGEKLKELRKKEKKQKTIENIKNSGLNFLKKLRNVKVADNIISPKKVELTYSGKTKSDKERLKRFI